MPNSDLKVLGEKVRKERKLAGLTQEQLAERCHVSTKHIANIEKGSMNPSYEILLAIARVLPVSLDALITPGMGKTEIELKEFNRIYLYPASPLSAPKWSFFIQREMRFFAGNQIGRFSNPKGRTAPKSIDFEGFREYTGSMNN